MTNKKTLSGWENKIIERYYYELLTRDDETDDFDNFEDEDYDEDDNPHDN